MDPSRTELQSANEPAPKMNTNGEIDSDDITLAVVMILALFALGMSIWALVKAYDKKDHHKGMTTLKVGAMSNATSITVNSTKGFTSEDTIILGRGKEGTEEIAVIKSITGNTIYLKSPLKNNHLSGCTVEVYDGDDY